MNTTPQADYLDEAMARLREEIFARNGSTVTLTKADAIEIHAAMQRREGVWIPVSERLPDSWQHVDVYPDPAEEDRTYNYYTTADGGTDGVKANRWYHSDRDGYDIEIHPTHWKPTSPPITPPPAAGGASR